LQPKQGYPTTAPAKNIPSEEACFIGGPAGPSGIRYATLDEMKTVAFKYRFWLLTRTKDARNLCASNAKELAMSATKKAANLSINATLLEEARACKINLSQTLETALTAELKKIKGVRWLEENRAAIEAYNREIAEHGLWSDGLRQF
jgi:antitoxin CcdA